MAAEQELVAPSELEPEVKKNPNNSTSCVDLEVSRDKSDAKLTGASINEFRNWATSKLIKQEMDLRHQLQESVKPVESLSSKWKDSSVTQLFKREDMKIPPLHSREAAWIWGQSFRCFCYQEAQGPKRAYAQLRDLCLQWLQPERHTKEEILELVILEQFLTILPLKIQSWLREIEPQNCAQAVILAEDFLIRQKEAKDLEQEALRPLGDAGASLSEAIQIPIDANQRPLCKEVKQESEADACFLEGNGLKSGNKRGSSEVLFVKTEWERMEEDAENIKRMVDAQEGTCKSKPMVAKRDQSQEVREQIVRGKKCNPGHKVLVNPSWKNKYQHGVPDCGEGFDYKSQLITHQGIHIGEDPHQCSVHGQGFEQSPHLMRHERFHLIGSMHQSSNSKESTQCRVSPSRLQRHSRGENPHQCADCGKSFRYKSQLTWHQRVHTGEKPYLCSDCGKSFSQRQHMIDHQKLHTGDNPHRCPDCGKSFSYMSQLLAHQRSHTGEKPFPCLDCALHFSRRTHLVRHQRNIHGIEK